MDFMAIKSSLAGLGVGVRAWPFACLEGLTLWNTLTVLLCGKFQEFFFCKSVTYY